MTPLLPKRFPVRQGGRVGRGKLTPRERIEDTLRYAAASLFGLFGLFVVIGIPVLLLITSTYGLGDAIRKRADDLLGGKNYEVHLGRVLFSPVSGFVLENLRVLDAFGQKRLIISADRVSVSLNMDSLLRGSPQLERVSLRDTGKGIDHLPSRTAPGDRCFLRDRRHEGRAQRDVPESQKLRTPPRFVGGSWQDSAYD